MGNKKRTKEEEKSTFTYKDDPDPINKYQRRIYIALASGGATILSLIILGSVFFNDRATFTLIFSFYCIYLWTLPLLFTTIRAHFFNKNTKQEQKKGRIFMVFGFYFLFLWIASLTALFILLAGTNNAWMADVVFWASTCVFLPYLLFVLIAKL